MDYYCLDKTYVLYLLVLVFERAPTSIFWENLFLDTKKSLAKLLVLDSVCRWVNMPSF